MSKRKRSSEPSLQDTIAKHSDEISRALKAAKGFERQRLSKRLHENGITPDKKERLDREILVLKSLDLHQTAHAHLLSSLLKIKSLAESPDCPEEIRRGLAKPSLSEEERVALHNVTSGLYQREPVKKALEAAIASVCKLLKIPVPEKTKRARKGKQEQQEKPEVEDGENEEAAGQSDVRDTVEKDEESEFEGFSDAPEDSLAPVADDLDSGAEEDEEKELSKYDELLGSSSDDEENFDDERFDRFRGKEKPNLDDISLSGDSAGGSDSEPEAQEPSPSSSPSPPPTKKKKSKSSTAPARPSGSTFLPSLMGGYISGSESASDVDVAPPKKRLGQRQRQAIYEKKFGAKAKHLQRPAKSKGGRDSGWDTKRGAVDGDGGERTPWKKGVRNPLARNAAAPSAEAEVAKPSTKRDDQGPLHASWEAKKKAKDLEKASFSGTKITFD